MTRQEFIFSDKRSHRFARHLAFWFIWCLAFNLLFHFPIHVYKGWDTSGPGTKNLQTLGLPLFFIKTLVVNSLFGVIVPQIGLTYAVFYWLLPNYFFKRKNLFAIALATIITLAIFLTIAACFKLSPTIYNTIARSSPVASISINGALLHLVIIDQLNSLPIILGIALMIKLVKRWRQKQKLTEQLAREKAKAELQLLKAQIHPHFLFNTLNNIYFFTLTNSTKAPVMVKKLSDLLNYIINECDQPLVKLEKEIKMIQDYMSLEKIRYAEQMQMIVDIDYRHMDKLIAPLLLIPFVENSFKHGASKTVEQPWVTLSIYVENSWLHFKIKNSKPANKNGSPLKGNIGLKNVKKRLDLLYPDAHTLEMISEPNIFTVDLHLKLHEAKFHTKEKDQNILLNDYTMA